MRMNTRNENGNGKFALVLRHKLFAKRTFFAFHSVLWKSKKKIFHSLCCLWKFLFFSASDWSSKCFHNDVVWMISSAVLKFMIYKYRCSKTSRSEIKKICFLIASIASINSSNFVNSPKTHLWLNWFRLRVALLNDYVRGWQQHGNCSDNCK